MDLVQIDTTCSSYLLVGKFIDFEQLWDVFHWGGFETITSLKWF